MVLLQAIEMDGEEQVRRWLEKMQFLLKKKRIRAKRDEAPLRDKAFDDLSDLFMDQRLAAGNGNHRCTAFLRGVQAFLDR